MAQPGRDLSQLIAELNKGSEPLELEPEREAAAPSSRLDPLLRSGRERGASDILLIAGSPPCFRIGGRLESKGAAGLDGGDIKQLLLPLLSGEQLKELDQRRSMDFCFTWKGLGRFRTNLHFQQGSLAGSIRLLPLKVPSLASLNLPPSLQALAMARQGLVLVTGATGSGKSSTLAALIDIINTERHDHVVTIEDPLEFIHPSRNSIVEHIEVGRDAVDFASSIRSIMRQSPDVIMVGEMRDAETIATALTAAETGHLVLSTLHTNDTSQAVSRILDSFPLVNQHQVRQQLSMALKAIIAQQLVPGKAGGRHPALEILMASNAVRSSIRNGDDHQLYSQISTGRADGMATMEQFLAEMVKARTITEETAVAHSFRPQELRRYLG